MFGLQVWNDLANENPGLFSEDGKPHGPVRSFVRLVSLVPVRLHHLCFIMVTVFGVREHNAGDDDIPSTSSGGW